MPHVTFKAILYTGPLLLASCTNATGDENSAASTVVAHDMLFALSRDGVPPAAETYLLDTGEWSLISQDACRAMRGTLAQDKITDLSNVLSDPELPKASSDCTGTSFKLVTFNKLGMSTQHLCWGDEARKSNQAIDALSQFFDDRVQELQWDGKKVEPCTNGTMLTPTGIRTPPSPDSMPAPMQ